MSIFTLSVGIFVCYNVHGNHNMEHSLAMYSSQFLYTLVEVQPHDFWTHIPHTIYIYIYIYIYGERERAKTITRTMLIRPRSVTDGTAGSYRDSVEFVPG